MALILRQSTAVDVLIGPFVDVTDGATAEESETPAVLLSKNGQTLAAKNDATVPVHDDAGYYNCELDTTDTNTVGTLVLIVEKTATALPVRHEFQVVETAVYDQLFADSAPGAATVAALATVDSNVDEILTDTGTTLQAELDAIQAAVITNAAGTDIAADIIALKAETAEILVDTGTTLQAELDGIQADTEDIQTRLPAALVGGNIIADVLAISGDTTAADRLEALMDGIIIAQVNGGTPTTTAFIADGFTEATDDHFNGRLITFLTGDLAGQQTDITDYVGSTQTLTVTALTEAPANDDFFVIH